LTRAVPAANKRRETGRTIRTPRTTSNRSNGGREKDENNLSKERGSSSHGKRKKNLKPVNGQKITWPTTLQLSSIPQQKELENFPPHGFTVAPSKKKARATNKTEAMAIGLVVRPEVEQEFAINKKAHKAAKNTIVTIA